MIAEVLALRRRGDYVAALELARTGGPDLLVELGRLQADFGDYEAAETTLQLALGESLRLPALIRLIAVRRDRGLPDAAVATADEVLAAIEQDASIPPELRCEALAEAALAEEDVNPDAAGPLLARVEALLADCAPDAEAHARVRAAVGSHQRRRGQWAEAEAPLRDAIGSRRPPSGRPHWSWRTP